MADSFQLKAIITGVDKLSPVTAKMSKNYQKSIKQMTDATKAQRASAARMMEGIALGTVGAMTAVSVAFARQETAATDLKVSMMEASGSVGAGFQKINDLAITLGNKLPGTTADFQEMMQTLVSQGVPTAKILDGVGQAAAYLAVELHEAPKDAALQMAQLQDATKATGGQILKLADMGQRMAFLGVSMGDSVSYFSSVSSALQMISKDGEAAARSVAPLAVEFSNAGLESSSAGNATRKMMQATLNQKKMGQVNNYLKKFGIHLQFVNKKGQFLGVKNFVEQVEKLNKLSDTDKHKVITKGWGDDNETLSALNTTMRNGVKGYENTQKKMDSQANLNQRVEASLKTLTNQWDSMKGSAENAAASVGKVFAPQIKTATDNLNSLSVKLDDAVKKYPKAAREFDVMATSITGVAIAIRGVKFAMGLLALNPYTATILALAGAAGYLIANKEELKTIYDKNKQTSKTAKEAMVDPAVTRYKVDNNKPPVAPLVYDPFGFNRPRSAPTGGMGIFPAGTVNTSPLKLYRLADTLLTEMKAVNSIFPYALTSPTSAPAYNYGAPGGQAMLSGSQELIVRFEGAPAGVRVQQGSTQGTPMKTQLNVGYGPYSPQSMFRGN